MRIEIKELEGKDHFVVPVVLITEGVHAGSDGPLFYSASELKKSVHLWNGKPIVAYHPSLYSSGLAGNPTIFNKQKVGTLFNAVFDSVGKKLKAEAWLDCSRLEKIDKRILDAIQNQEMMEVSTGLFTDKEDMSGMFGGKMYDAIAHNFKPDHLAILPDLIGACSIADGAGLLRNAGQNEEILFDSIMQF